MPSWRFHGELNDLLPSARRDRCFRHEAAEHATLGHAIEALGVPHTEIGAVLVDGCPADLRQQVSDSDCVEVHPAEPSDRLLGGSPLPGRPRGARSLAGGSLTGGSLTGGSLTGGSLAVRLPGGGEDLDDRRFLADAHLGGLARRLRLLGFDTVLAADAPDPLLAELAERERRIVLSRDRELLKHRRVARGRYVRAIRTDEQMREVVARFGLQERLRPFTRCLECNAALREAAAGEVAARVPPRILASQQRFTVCPGCARVYWPGSHWQRLAAVVQSARTAGDRTTEGPQIGERHGGECDPLPSSDIVPR